MVPERVMTAKFPHIAGKYGTEPLVLPVAKTLFYSILPSVTVGVAGILLA